jgi:hypothetical protein
LAKNRTRAERNRKARNVVAVTPSDANYDTLLFAIEKRERARAARRAKKDAVPRIGT